MTHSSGYGGTVLRKKTTTQKPAVSVTIVDKPRRRGGGGTSTPTPISAPALSITIVDKPKGGGGGSGLTDIQKFEASKDLIGKIGVLEKSGLSKEESEALAKREEARRESIRRGKGFTRLELERFLGGGKGIKSLRKAMSRIRKAGAGAEIQKFLRDIPEAISPGEISTIAPDIAPYQLGIGDITETKESLRDVMKFGIFPTKTKEILKDVLKFGTQYFGGYLGEPLTPKERTILGDLPISPIRQYKVFKSRKEFEEAIKEANKVIDKLETESENFENKWGNLVSENQFIGTEDQYKQYSKDFKKLDIQINTLTQNPKFQKTLIDAESRKTIFQRISKSSLPIKQKTALSVLAGAGQFVPYFSAPLRILYGAESIVSGAEAFPKAETLGQKAMAGGEIGIGLILTKSGLKGGASVLGKAGRGETIMSRVAKMERDLGLKIGGRPGGIAQRGLEFAESRGRGVVTKVGIPSFFAGTQAVNVYSQTEDLAVSLGAGAGGLATITAPIIYEGIRGGTKPTQLEKQELSKGLDKLESSRVTDLTIIRKGAGSRPNTDRVDIIANQRFGNFDRTIRISGDLRRGEKGLTFFPKGKGNAITLGRIKVKGQSEKGFVDLQKFNLKQVTKGINLGEIQGYQIGTTQSISQYLPKGQLSTLFKVPKGRGIVLETRVAKERIKQFLQRKRIQKGGEVVLEYEPKGKTFVAEKRQTPPDTEPYSKKPKEFDITKESEILGKVAGERPIESVGMVTSEKRLGAFLKLGEPPKVEVIKKKGKIKKTPLSKTFAEEPPIKIAPRKLRPTQEQVQIKREIPKEVTEPKIEKFTEQIIETTRKGLKGKTRKVVEKLDTISTDIPAVVYGQVSKTLQREGTKLKELQKVKQKQKLDVAVIDMQKELQKEVLGQRELQKQKQLTKLIPEQVLAEPFPKIRARGAMRPSRAGLPPFVLRKRKIVVKKPLTKKKGYNVFIKSKGKYRKVTKSPIGLKEAENLRAYGLDRSTARSGRILPTKKYASPPSYDIPMGYARDTKRKFRSFRQKKGKRTMLKKTIIERGKYLIDTPQEKKELNIFKLLARREKKRRQGKSSKPVGLQFA